MGLIMGIAKLINALIATAAIGCAHVEASPVPMAEDVGCDLSYAKNPLAFRCDDIVYDTSTRPSGYRREKFGPGIPANIETIYYSNISSRGEFVMLVQREEGERCPDTVFLEVPNGTAKLELDDECNVWNAILTDINIKQKAGVRKQSEYVPARRSERVGSIE
jgi:hypothetical protein